MIAVITPQLMYVLFTYENLMALSYYNHLQVRISKDVLL